MGGTSGSSGGASGANSGGGGGNGWSKGPGDTSGRVLGDGSKELRGFEVVQEMVRTSNSQEGPAVHTYSDGKQIERGQASVAVSQAVEQARRDADKAVTDERVPRRYHESIKKYFDQMPTNASSPSSSSPSPSAAPAQPAAAAEPAKKP